MMSECPSRELLSALILGKLPLETIEGIGRHVETCATCQATLESLDELEDSLVANIKALPDIEPVDPRLEQQINRVLKPNKPEEPLPVKLRDYEIQERIGQGGMGTVYKALHTKLKRVVAIKVLPQNRLRDPQAVTRFQREMEAVGRLDHPNLVHAYDAGEADGRHYLAMEFLDGIDLRKLVRKRGPLSVANACKIIRQAALGLQYAHEHGLVHRDVKPSNLMLTSNRTVVKLLDLGLARLVEEPAYNAEIIGEVTATEQVLGTVDFISPEQIQDTRNADARSDIYSLGCTLYFLLTGRAPFPGPQYDTFGKKLVAHAREPIPPIQTIRKDVPDTVAAIIERMTAKAPEQRFQTAAEVAEAMATITSPPVSPASKHRWPMKAVAAAIAVIVLLIMSAVMLVSGKKVPPTKPPKRVSPFVVQEGRKVGERMVLTINGVEYPFRWCPAETFVMGSPKKKPAKKKARGSQKRTVTLTNGFWMLETPVTQEMWESVTGSNPSEFKGSKKLPVENVSWNDCQEYIRKLNSLGIVPEGYKFSLPTEAQWEYACRAGSTTKYCFGNDESKLGEYAWWSENSGRMPHPVGQKIPNAWGLYDMHGNVDEWCFDWFGKNYLRGSATDPMGPSTGSHCVRRGGSWNSLAKNCLSTSRIHRPPSERNSFTGLRIALLSCTPPSGSLN